MTSILSAADWRHNGDLIADVFRLDVLAEAVDVIDLTYGEGKFWSQFTPPNLVKRDAKLGDDFRALTDADASYDVAVFDPPYTHGSGRVPAASMGSFVDRYGLGGETPSTWGGLRALMLAGFDEAIRVTRNRGWVLVKSMPYVASSRLRHGPYEFFQRSEERGDVRLYDEFVMSRQPGPDTARRKNGQHHARHNHSVLQVFQVWRPRGAA